MWWTFLMRRKNPRGCHLWGFLVRYGEPLRIGCCCLFISVQPFAYVAANYTCYNRDKKCGEQFGHGRTPPFCWRFGSVYSISHFILIFYNFLLMKTMIDIKKEAVWNSIQLHDLSGNRTRVYAVRGRRLDRLTNRPESRRRDSNTRPLRPERSALPNWATPRYDFLAFEAVLISDSYILSRLQKKCKRFFEKNWKSFKKLKKPFKINIFTLLTYISKLLWIT